MSRQNTCLAVERHHDTPAEEISRHDHFGRVLGRSVAMRSLFAVLERVAVSEATILIEGETGTGKSALAEAVHEHSRRASGPFVVIDCGALPGGLLESELFGHERGAFTGAVSTRIGLLESARGGTVLFDEIGELPLDLQPKLLRALERRMIRRVGSTHELPVDVRLIAATHRDLRREVTDGKFRPDLWYRLNTIRVTLPPLRERREDIAMLVGAFYRELTGRDAAAPSELVQAMMRGVWRGNVRELRSAIERALIGAPILDDSEVLGASTAELSYRAARFRATSDWERTYLRELLPAHDGNITRAARAARMDRSHLSELVRRHGLGTEPGE